MKLLSLKLKHSRWLLRSHGLEPKFVELENGSTIHCWVPVGCKTPHPTARWKVHGVEHVDDGSQLPLPQTKNQESKGDSQRGKGSKPSLLLVHGLGSDGTLSWDAQVAALTKDFDLYIPDLICFGETTTCNKERSELFQAECMVTMMYHLGVRHAVVAGHSYGGFVAFRMAHLFPNFVTRLIIISAGILTSPANTERLLHEHGADKVSDVLVPESMSDIKRSVQLVYNKLPSCLPTCLFKDMFEYMNINRPGRLELLDSMVLGTEEASPVPHIHQDVLIIWGERDRIFKVELAHQLKDFLGQKAMLMVVKGVGHVPHVERAKFVNKLIKQFV